MKARIELTFSSTEDSEQVRRSIYPDNTPLPDGMTIESSVEGNILVLEIISERGIDSFRGTIEDIMSAIDLSVRTIELTD